MKDAPSEPPPAYFRDPHPSQPRGDISHHFYHETIYQPFKAAFMVFVTSVWKYNGQSPSASSFSPFGIITVSAHRLVLLQGYLGFQSSYNIFKVVSVSSSGDSPSVGIIAISREIPCPESGIPAGPMEYTPHSIPNSIRTTVPLTCHTYAGAIFWGVPLSDCVFEEFPTPSIFVVD